MFVWLAWWAGCTGAEVEGDDAGECRDGADNDQNGQFDCDDPGCVGSPDCDPGSTDPTGTSGSGSTGSTGTDTGTPPDDPMSAYCGTGPAAVTDLATVDLTLTLSFEILPAFSYVFDDCSAEFVGTGASPTPEGDCVTFDGTWELERSTCAKALLPDDPQVVWVGTQGSDAFHTFHFTNGGAELEAWITHANRREGVPSSSYPQQFWVTEIDDAMADNMATYSESQALRQSAIEIGTLHITFDAQFTRQAR